MCDCSGTFFHSGKRNIRPVISEALPDCISDTDQDTAGIAGEPCDDKPDIVTGNDPGEDEWDYRKYHHRVTLLSRSHSV
jgi:hypothetical protein